MSLATRLLLAATILSVLGLLAFSVNVYPDLPARIPTHFGASGAPDGFGPRSNWWFLPGVTAVSSLILIAVVVMIPRRPDLLNLPSKPEILALPPAAQREVVRHAQPGLMLLGLFVAIAFAYVQYVSWTVATGRGAGRLSALLLAVPIISIATIPAIMIPVQRELRRQQAAISARKAATAR